MRAIHLELLENLTAKQFLGCLRTYVKRRGKQDKILLDRSLQFEVVKNVININEEKVPKSPDALSHVNNIQSSCHS